MAKRRKQKGPSKDNASLPSAAELLGAFVTRMAFPDVADVAPLRTRNAERFLAGETKPPEVAEAVVRCLASSLLRHEYISTAGWPTDLGFPSAELLLWYAIRDLRGRWDRACIEIRSGLLRGVSRAPVVQTASQLLAIDIALRAGAWVALTRGSMPEAPDCLTVARVMERAIAATKLSVPSLARELGIDRTAIDAWRRGARPKDASLFDVATRIADDRATRDALHRAMRRDVARAELMANVARIPGAATDVWQTSHWIAREVSKQIPMDDRRETSQLLTGLVMWGSGYERAQPLLARLRGEAPATWRADLDPCSAWSERLVYAARVGRSHSNVASAPPAWATQELLDAASDAMLASPTGDIRSIPDGWNVYVIKNPPDVAAENHRMQASVALSRGDIAKAIVHRRRAVELAPRSALARFELGAALGRTSAVDEAVDECRKALEIQPDWELANVEIGIIFLNANRATEARVHLERVLASSSAPTTHLRYNLAAARWQCADFAGALELFEAVLADKNYASYPHALSQAAHCAFKVGDPVRGRALAKDANALGASEAYRLWQAGAYRGS